MRFADGSVKTGYNVHLAASATGMVVSVMATERRYGRVPKRLLVDTNYAPADDIVALASREGDGVLVYAPPPEERADVKPETLKRRATERAKEAPALKDWRQRMDTAQGQSIYRSRKRIELVNAHMKNRGFERLNLRGLLKAKIVALWHALAHNILVAHRLRLAKA